MNTENREEMEQKTGTSATGEKLEEKKITRAEKAKRQRTIIRSLLTARDYKWNELLDEATKVYFEKHKKDENGTDLNDLKGKIGSSLSLMEEEGEIRFDKANNSCSLIKKEKKNMKKKEEIPTLSTLKKTEEKKILKPVAASSLAAQPTNENKQSVSKKTIRKPRKPKAQNTVLAQPIKNEDIKTVPIKTETLKSEPVETGKINTEETKVETVKAEPVKTEVAKSETVKTEPVKTEVAKSEIVKTEVAKVEIVKTEPVKTDTIKFKSVEITPVKTEEKLSEKVKMEEPVFDLTSIFSPKGLQNIVAQSNSGFSKKEKENVSKRQGIREANFNQKITQSVSAPIVAEKKTVENVPAPIVAEKKAVESVSAPMVAEKKTVESVPAPVVAEKKTVANISVPVVAEKLVAEKKEVETSSPISDTSAPKVDAPAISENRQNQRTERRSTRTSYHRNNQVERPASALTEEEKLKVEFLKRLRALGGEYFEYYSIYLLERYSMKNGRRLESLKISGGEKDGGIDGELELTDKFGFKETIYIQAKNWDPSKGDAEKWVVGETLLQQFIGAVVSRQAKEGKRGARGIFMTTSRFTIDARAIFSDMNSDFIGYDGDDIFEAAKECMFGLSIINGKLALDEKLLSGEKAFFNMI